MAKQKAQTFKLGPKATNFYDPVSQKKVLPGQKVEFEPHEMATTRFRDAKAGGHLVPHDPADDENKDAEIERFGTLDIKKKRKEINKTWDLTDEDKKKVEEMTEEELVTYYTGLINEDEEE